MPIEFSPYLDQYFPILVTIAIAVGISGLVMILPWLFAHRQYGKEKHSAYECGFDSFDDSRMKFDIKFYLVAILFIIFDLEVAFLFPWAIHLGNLSIFGFASMMIFLLLLVVGFIYEWRKGALDWA